MAVATAWTRRDSLGQHRFVMCKVTYDNGDTAANVATGLKIIYSYDVSVPAVTAKAVDYAVVTGGTIAIHMVNPLAPDYFFVRAFGI